MFLFKLVLPSVQIHVILIRLRRYLGGVEKRRLFSERKLKESISGELRHWKITISTLFPVGSFYCVMTSSAD